jgi:hypothetical protein
MFQGKYVFSQLCDFLSKRVFDGLVGKYDGNKYVKHFTCWNQLLSMMFGQLSGRDSLRDLITSLEVHKSKFHHLGFGTNVTRSNLAKARNSRAVKDFFVEGNVFAFDSSTIALCLNVFWWAKYRRFKSGIKLHTLYDVKTDIPAFNIITDAKVSDPKVMPLIPYGSVSYYIFDRACMDSKNLSLINKIGAYFVVREKTAMHYKVKKDQNYCNKETGIMADQTIILTGNKTRKHYSQHLRRVVFYEVETNRIITPIIWKYLQRMSLYCINIGGGWNCFING